MKITLKSIVSIICVLSMVVVPFTSYAVDTNETPEENYAYGYIPDDPEWVASVPEFSPPSTYSAITVPSSCDNSTSPYFPEIGDQGSVGACTAFATTYYQFTYEANRYLDVATTPENTYHPQWTYSLGNRGNGPKGGIHFETAYSILENLGSLKYSDYSRTYNMTNSDDKNAFSFEISTNTSAIRNALSLRAQLKGLSIPRPGGTAIDFEGDDPFSTAKSLIASGSVLVIGCHFSVDKMTAHRSGTHAGDYVAVRSNDRKTAYHAMAVVGYDDNICVDVNKDGIIQDAERGAFKIANSWGTDEYIQHNNGFIWVLYDAFNDVSAHPDTNWESGYKYSRVSFNYEPGNSDIKFYCIQVSKYDNNFICQVDIDTTDFYKLKYMQTSRQTADSDEPDASADYSGLSMANTPRTGCEHTYTGTLFFDFATLSSPISQMHAGYDWYIKLGVFDRKLEPIGDDRYIYVNETPEDWTASIRIIDNLGNTISDLGAIDSYSRINRDCYYATKKASINIALGDINYDGQINDDDILCIKKYMVRIMTYSSVQEFIADVDGDGEINARDILAIKRIMVGIA